MVQAKRYPRTSLCDEKGMALVVGLLLIAVLVLLGTTAIMTSTTDIKISANYKTGNQAFYAAEAGIEEAKARLKEGAANPITDAHPTEPQWTVYIGAESNAQSKGYNSGNSMHVRVPSLQSTLDYTVKIVHKTDASGTVLLWGDSNIYLVTSYGAASGAAKRIDVEMTLIISVPGALYVEAPTTIQGTSTHILGADQCGSDNKPGIVTTLATSTVGTSGNPTITGDPSGIVSNPAANLSVQAMINSLKGDADYTYNVAGATHSGMHWGTPTPGATQDNPSICSERHVVYYNTSNGTNLTDIQLTGSTGCGILLVDGDLDANGGFSWNGIILVSGSVRITGGGTKNITGGLLAGGSMDADLVGGNVSIVYCSSAVDQAIPIPQSLRNLSWRESEGT